MEQMIKKIKNYTGAPMRIMEVCGTHTMHIAKYGIKQILPPQVELISGPGCPVCVTPTSYFAIIYNYAKLHNCILATFGDLLKVPFHGTSLEKERSKGFDIRLLYSPLECLKLAKENSNKQVVFLAVGFETTAPITALLVSKAKQQNLTNLKIAIGHKSILPAIDMLLKEDDNNISGLLYPGNVGAIIGSDPFFRISTIHQVKGCMCGFDAEDIVRSLYSILYGENLFSNQYTRVVTERGNTKALDRMEEVFQFGDSTWRGIGCIKDSGYTFQEPYSTYDMEEITTNGRIEEADCLCGEIIKGKKKPRECKQFAKECTPFSPIGPCMVSSEGTCSAAYLLL